MVAEGGSGSGTLGLWEKWRAEGGAGSPGFVSLKRQEKEEAYQAAAEAHFADQNCFKVFFKVTLSSASQPRRRGVWGVHLEEETGEMTLELVDTDGAESGGKGGTSPADWASLVSALVDGEEEAAALAAKPLFLLRSLRKGKAAFGHAPLHAENVSAVEGLEMAWARGASRPKWVAWTGDAFVRGAALRRGRLSLSHATRARRQAAFGEHISRWLSRNAQEGAEVRPVFSFPLGWTGRAGF